MFVYMDIESQSTANLREVGSKAYIRDAATRLLTCVFKCGEKIVIWIPEGRLPVHGEAIAQFTSLLPGEVHVGNTTPTTVQQWLSGGCTFVAHNAEGFDAEFWRVHVGSEVPRWLDTAHYCRHAGLPAKLDTACKAIGGKGKSDNAAMRLLTTAKVRGGAVVYPRGTIPLWAKLIRYNIDDVLELEFLHKYLLHIPMTHLEAQVLALNTRINQRGFYVDLSLAAKLRDAWAEVKIESTDNISAFTGGALNDRNIRSPQQVKKYLASLGLPLDSIDKRTVDQILENPQDFIDDHESDAAVLFLAVLAERQQAVRNTVGKIDKLFHITDPDGAVRNSLVYCGAQTTGRFSGRDLQPHNFYRGLPFDDTGETLRHLIELAHEGNTTLLGPVKSVAERLKAEATKTKDKRNANVANVLSTLTRCLIRARPGHKLVIADFAGIEARCVAWLAKCESMLHLFATGGDVYCDMASKLYNRHITKKDKDERFVGKQIILGCGYQMAGEKFEASCAVQLVDLAAANTNGEACVTAYRKGYPEIPALWRAYHNAANYVVRTGRMTVAGRCRFEMQGSWFCITLPSGRVLRYRNARIEKHPAKWDATKLIDGVWYDTAYGFRKSLYGGIITENISQGHCRDLLAAAMVGVDPLYPVVLDVHDEIISEVPEGTEEAALEAICRAMVSAPDWSYGFPIGVEGFTSIHYTKYKFPGVYHLTL